MILRPYQRAAREAASADLLERGKACVQQATGTGKTPVLASIAADIVEAGGRVLVAAHREELLNQAAATLRRFGLRAEIEQGRRHAGASAQVVVASVATMRGKRRARWAPDYFDLIIVDECHHGAAKSYTAIFEWFSAAMVLGVTATPWRGDGKSLAKIFGHLSFSYDIRQAIRDGWLVPLRPHRITVAEVDLDGVAVRSGDFVAKQLDEAYADDHALHAVARPLLEMAGERPTIVFASGIEHGARLAAVINGYKPEAAVALSGKSDPELRKSEVARFGSSRQFLVNCALFTEGTDLPACSCVAMARPTKSKTLVTQMIGRGTRLADGALDFADSVRKGKADCVVLDFTGVTTKHRLASPVSVMAEDGTAPEVIDEAERILAEEQVDVGEALARAAESVAERIDLEAREAKVRYFAEQVDPFLGTVGTRTERWAGDPASKGQMSLLADHGFKPAVDLTNGEASAIIDAITRRRARGLCSVKVARKLANMGVDASELSADAGAKVMAKWREAGWRLTRRELKAITAEAVATEASSTPGGEHARSDAREAVQ